jgi:hypothetical protein
MADAPRITLEQWRALRAVVEEGARLAGIIRERVAAECKRRAGASRRKVRAR